MYLFYFSVLIPEGHVEKSSVVHALVCYLNSRIGKLLFMIVMTSEISIYFQYYSFSFALREQLHN